MGLFPSGGFSMVGDKTLKRHLIETFTPQSLTTTSDSQGGFTKSWTAGSTFEGRLSMLGIDERLAEDKMTVIATHRLFALTDVTVTEEDQITLGSRTFKITGVQKPSNTDTLTGAHLEITLLEVDGDS
jgi:head-tail adaptor